MQCQGIQGYSKKKGILKSAKLFQGLSKVVKTKSERSKKVSIENPSRKKKKKNHPLCKIKRTYCKIYKGTNQLAQIRYWCKLGNHYCSVVRAN